MENEQKPKVKTDTCYLICATHRVGSSLLCEALANTGLAGRPAEYFWRDTRKMWSERWGIHSFREYLTGVKKHTTTPNGVFGTKTSWECLQDLVQNARELPEYHNLSTPDLLESIFPNLHYVYMSRRDKVRQAVSLWRAVQTRVWTETFGKTANPAREPEFDFERIEYWRQYNHRNEKAWKAFFAENGIMPHTVDYQDLVDDYESTAIEILRYLGVSIPVDIVFGPRRLKKQADELSEEWVQRYRNLRGQHR